MIIANSTTKVFASYMNKDGEWVSSTSFGDNENDNDESGGGGSGTYDDTADRINRQLEDCNECSEDADEISKDVDKVTDTQETGLDDSEIKDSADENLDTMEETLDKEKDNAEENANDAKEKNDEKNSSKKGDPVRVSEGVYEQFEIDVEINNLDFMNIQRKYLSNNKIISSFGYGWTTNLDERIILGTEADAVNTKRILVENVSELSFAIAQVENTIKDKYKVSSLDKAETELTERLNYLVKEKNKTNSILKRVNSLYNNALDSSVKSRASAAKSKVDSLLKKIENRIDIINKCINSLPDYFTLIEELQNKYQKAVDIYNDFEPLYQLSMERKQKNKKAFFSGMDLFYEETGLSTITIIDEDANPYVLYESDENSGVWTGDLKKYINCQKIENGYKVFEAGGIEKEYDNSGFIVKITDLNGKYIEIVRNADESIDYIKTVSGEKYLFTYENQKIKSITNFRDDTENVVYSYDGIYLTSVKDADGDVVHINYDSDGHLTKLVKNDGSFISYSYNEYGVDGKTRTTTTIDEENNTEYFVYDPVNCCTKYTNHDGDQIVIVYDEKHRTIKETEADGQEIFYSYDEEDNLVEINENGNVTRFVYDKQGNKTDAFYSDGSSEHFEYNDFKQLIKYQDRDNCIFEYVRDAKGNVTEYKEGGRLAYSQEFDNAGNVISIIEYISEPVRTDFEYDDFGNVITVTKASSKSEYTYDNRNRLKTVVTNGKQISTYQYNGKITEKKDFNGLVTIYEYNGRKDLVRVTQKDLLSDKIHENLIEYDKRHLPVKIFVSDGENKELITGYLYTPEGKIQAKIFFGKENYIQVYKYQDGKIKSEKQFCVKGRLNQNLRELNLDELEQKCGEKVYEQKYDYILSLNNRNSIIITDGYGSKNIFEYDSFGNLISCVDGNGEKRINHYSSAGRINREESEHGGFYVYGYDSAGNVNSLGEENSSCLKTFYYPNGKLKEQIDRYGKRTEYVYNSDGLIKSVKSENKNIWYTYDAFERLIKQSVGKNSTEENCDYYLTYDYSENGRFVTLVEGGLYKTVYELDAFGNVVKKIDGNKNEVLYQYNCRNQLISETDAYNRTTFYEYNSLGNINRIVNADGTAITYAYNYLGFVEKITDEEGVVYKADYDKTGRLITVWKRGDSERNYEYDNTGRVTKIICGGEVVESYVYGEKGRSVTVKDGNNHDYIYNYDYFARLINEKNRNGDEQYYYYDCDGKLQKEKTFDGFQTVINFSNNQTEKIVQYSDNEINRFVYNPLGNILEAENENGRMVYEYDKGGCLILQRDEITGEEIRFSYDSAKNRTKMLSSNRETVYEYGKNNEVLSISDKKQQIDICLKYDAMGREIERRFGNGVLQNIVYDKAGRPVIIFQKLLNGEISWAEGYVYGDDGKRIATINEKGEVTFYEYNQKGQLKTVFYPYTQSIVEKMKEEAEKYELNLNVNIAENKFIAAELFGKLRFLMNEIVYSWGNKVLNFQLVVKESYDYDGNDNRISKTTPFGTINYSYDFENRLVSSGANGKSIVKYSYDKKGNLLSCEDNSKSIKYAYNKQNRVVFSEVINHASKIQTVSRYAYDAFGRRMLVQDNQQSALKTLYDGFTFDVVKQAATFENGLFTNSGEYGGSFTKSGRPTGERYRYLDDDSKDENRYFDFGDGYKAGGGRYLGERSCVFVNGTLAAQSTDDGLSYFTTDLLGSVKNVSDVGGITNANYNYDVFGALVEGELSAATDYGYLGKQCDSATGLYNYGYRDYAPEVARFTTVDPVRDGENWFAYVRNDPVNFVDLWGLKNLKPFGITMQNEQWGNQVTGNANGVPSSTNLQIKENGCYLSGYSEAAITLTGKDYTPDYFNQYSYLFDSNQNFDSTKASEITGLQADYWTQSVQGDLSNKINELNNSDTHYVVMAQIEYKKDGDLHWVTIYGGTDTTGYVNIVGTSNNDYNKNSERGQLDSWQFNKDCVKIKASEIKQLRTFKNK